MPNRSLDKKFKTTVAAVRLTSKEVREIEQIVRTGLFVSESEFIRNAVRDKLRAMRAIELRGGVSMDKIKKEIMELLGRRGEKMYTSDIADELRLDLMLVFEAMEELKKEGKVA